jgi:hypothetical protein
MNRHKFKVGQSVYYLGRESASGTYKITQLLPPEGDDFQYRIKNAREPATSPEVSMSFDYTAPAELFLSKRTKEHELGRAA